MPDMLHPALQAGRNLLQRDLPTLIGPQQETQLTPVVDPLSPFQAPPMRKYHKTQKRHTLAHRPRVGSRIACFQRYSI